MLADQLDYVVGVDPHRDVHAFAVVHVLSGAVVFETNVAAESDGYAQALKLADQYAAGRRAFAVEGAGSFGAGSRAISLPEASGSRSVGYGGSAARAASPTRWTPSAQPAPCSRSRGRRRRARAASAKRYGR